MMWSLQSRWHLVDCDLLTGAGSNQLLEMSDVRVLEFVPVIRVEETREIGVPETVIGGAPGSQAVPAIEVPFGRSWME